MSRSIRSEVVARRTYHRPLDFNDPSKGFESWPDVIDRCIRHQQWLWERAQHTHLSAQQYEELEELRTLMLNNQALLAGRTLWLGGTDKAKKHEACMFNCAFTQLATPSDFVDMFWLLLQGCGVGFEPVPGNIYGFASPIPNITFVPSVRSDEGNENNIDTYNRITDTWTIKVGDSSQAWAKLIGILLTSKHQNCKELIIDFSEIRPAGIRLRGFGWVSHGHIPLQFALTQIIKIMNQQCNRPLTFANIHDIANLLGTVLSTRRSAQLAQCPSTAPGVEEFATFKKDMDNGPWWRCQSNNAINFVDELPPSGQIRNTIDLMVASGGSEPSIRNQFEAERRAPYCKGTNPCAEILLPNKGFCNLVEINIAHPLHRESITVLKRTIMLMARANYRQTCVNLRDEILQPEWHTNNQALRLCGVSLTGLALRPDLTEADFLDLQEAATEGADGMAMELKLPWPARVTTGKPSGTLSKVMDTSEGFHTPLGRYIFNWISFGQHDPIKQKLIDAGYTHKPHPNDPNGMLICLPVDFGAEPVIETAVQQLERYKMYMRYWCHHNMSCTIYYEPNEIESIKVWLTDEDNWKHYVGVSFLPRNPTATYSYYPQVKVSEEEYSAYIRNLKPVSFGDTASLSDDNSPDCAAGACPVK